MSIGTSSRCIRRSWARLPNLSRRTPDWSVAWSARSILDCGSRKGDFGCLCHGRLYRIPRQGTRVSRVGSEVDAVLRPRYFPGPNQSLVIGKERAFAGDQLFHEQGDLGLVGREASNIVKIPMVVEYICEDHCVPGRVGHLQCFPGSLFRRLAGEILKHGAAKCRNVSEIFRLGYAVRPSVSPSVPRTPV